MKMKTIVSVFALALCASSGAWAGGVEQAEASGNTRAEACNSALSTATIKTMAAMGRVIDKRCECSESRPSNNSYVLDKTPWSCVGFVTWADNKK